MGFPISYEVFILRVVMELSPRTLVAPILLLSGGFIGLLTTSVLAFFEILSLTAILYSALASVAFMVAGVTIALWLSFHKNHSLTSRRPH